MVGARQCLNAMRIIPIWVIISLALSGCASSERTSPSGPDSSTPHVASASVSGSLLIWYALPQDAQPTFETIAANYAAAHSAVDVQAVAYTPDVLKPAFEDAVNQAAGPDLLIGPSDWIAPLARAGMLRAIPTGTLAALLEYVPAPALDLGRVDDEHFAVPIAVEFPLLYTDTARIPDPPRQYRDLIRLGNQDGLLIPPDFFATANFYLSDAPHLPGHEQQPVLSRSALLTYFTTLHDLAGIDGIQFTRDQAAFLQREASMMIAPASHYQTLLDALGDDLGATFLADLSPTPGSRQSIPVEFTSVMLNLNATARAVTLAGDFLTYLVSEEAQRLWPPGSELAPVSPYAVPATLQPAWTLSLERGVWLGRIPAFENEWLPRLDAAVSELVTGQADPQALVDHLLPPTR